MSTEQAGLVDPLSRRELLATLHRCGGEVLAHCGEAGLDAPVPDCPGWQVRDLLRHLGGIHTWAQQIVASATTEPDWRIRDMESLFGGWPSDDELIDRCDEALERLVATLSEAPEDLDCWHFFPGASPLWFWTRRQAHETQVHGIDAAHAAGRELDIAPAFAADGLDELLRGFTVRLGTRFSAAEPERLIVICEDTGDRFECHVTDQARTYLGGAGDHSAPPVKGERICEVRASAPLLYRWAWSRAGREGLAISGDLSVIDHFDESLHIG